MLVIVLGRRRHSGSTVNLAFYDMISDIPKIGHGRFLYLESSG